MADAERRKPLQDAHASNYVTYGHFGTTSYDEETKKWSFLRKARPQAAGNVDSDHNVLPFRLVRAPIHILDAAAISTEPEPEPGKIASNHFLKLLPEITPSITERETSRLTFPSQSDELVAPSLLSFGSAAIVEHNRIQSRSQTTPVAAYVSSAATHRLILILLNQETASVNLDSVKYVQVPGIAGGESTTWESSCGPIQQVCFSSRRSYHGDTWLALRQTSAVTIFQPLYHRATVVSTASTSLDLNLVGEIPISRTGGLKHADISFHPKDQSQVAIIDVGGNWSIWKIKGGRSRSAHVSFRIHLTVQGSFASRLEALQQYDGWHKIRWSSKDGEVADGLLIANRQSIATFDVHGTLISALDVRIGSREEGWALDLVPAVGRGEHFILTASHIFLITVNVDEVDLVLSGNDTAVSVLACWNHFRARDDITLRMYTIASHDGIWLLLASIDKGPVTAYHCSQSEDGHTGSVLVCDPLIFDTSFTQNNGINLLGLELVMAEPSNPEEKVEDSAFFKLFYQATNGHVCEVLFHIENAYNETSEPLDAIPLPRKKTLQHTTTVRVDDMMLDEDLVDFVVADEALSITSSHYSNTDATMLQNSQLTQATRRDAQQSRTCDLQRVYKFIATQLLSSMPEGRFSIDSVLETIEESDHGRLAAQKLSHIVTNSKITNLLVTDIESESQKLDNWIQSLSNDVATTEDGQRFSVSRVTETRSLIEIYSDLVDRWMSPLSHVIPDRFRVQRERLLRQVALETYLSSILIIPSPHSASQALNQQSWDSASIALATSSQTRLPSEEYLPSSPPVAPVRDDVRSGDRFSVLRQYVDFREPDAATNQDSAIMNDILAHLPSSADANPDDYSYNDTELSLAIAENELEVQDMDPKARRKAEKLAKTRKRQLEKQTQLKKVAFEQATAIPSVMSSQLPIRGAQSSQAVPLMGGSSQTAVESVPQLSMTQPERGVFGKRDTKKIKLKGKGGRQKGF